MEESMAQDGLNHEFSEHPPDFYLASMDYFEFNCPRRCWRIREIHSQHRTDLLLVRVAPSVSLTDDEKETRQATDRVILAARYEGESTLDHSKLPISVIVAVGPPGIEQTGFVRTEELTVIAWAEIYRTEQDALRSVQPQ